MCELQTRTLPLIIQNNERLIYPGGVQHAGVECANLVCSTLLYKTVEVTTQVELGSAQLAIECGLIHCSSTRVG